MTELIAREEQRCLILWVHIHDKSKICEKLVIFSSAKYWIYYYAFAVMLKIDKNYASIELMDAFNSTQLNSIDTQLQMPSFSSSALH